MKTQLQNMTEYTVLKCTCWDSSDAILFRVFTKLVCATGLKLKSSKKSSNLWDIKIILKTIDTNQK